MKIHIIIKVRGLNLFLGIALTKLRKFDLAICMYDHALQINSNNELTFGFKGKKLRFNFRIRANIIIKI